MYPQAIHSRFQLLSNLPTLPDPAANQFPSIACRTDNLVYRARKLFLRLLVCLVEVLEMREGCAFRGYHMDGRVDRSRVLRRVQDAVYRLWRGHGETCEGLG